MAAEVAAVEWNYATYRSLGDHCFQDKDLQDASMYIVYVHLTARRTFS